MARRIHLAFRLLLGLLVTLTPLIVAQLTLYMYHEALLSRLVPIWSDEILYWHQAVSFRSAGFNTGYYTVLEIPAQLGISRFYTWGMLIPMLYGSLGIVFNWSLAFIPLVNLCLLCLSIGVFLYSIRANVWQIILMGFLIGTFIPFIIYSMASLLPILQQAIAITLATLFYALITYRTTHATSQPRWLIALTGMMIVLACLVRIWWGILFIPYLVLCEPKTISRRLVLSIIGGGALLLVVAWFTRLSGAPFPYWYSDVYATSGMPTTLMENLRNNISLINEGNVLEIWLRRQFVVVLGLVSIAVVISSIRGTLASVWQTYAIIGYCMMGILAFVLPFYDVFEWRDFRILAPVLLFALVVLLAQHHYWVIAVVIGLNVWLMPEALKVYDIWSGWHIDAEKHNAYYAWEAELEKVMVYDSAADNGWCNTVLHAQHYLFGPTSTLLAVDAGLGLSSPLFLEDFSPPFKSRYLMLDEATYKALQADLNVEQLMTIPNGYLYLNLDTACPN